MRRFEQLKKIEPMQRLFSKLSPSSASPTKKILTYITSVSQFEKLVLSAPKNEIVIAHYYAPWCEMCAEVTPTVERQITKHPDVTVIKINADKIDPELTEKFIQKTVASTFPMTILVSNGDKKAFRVGYMVEEEIERLIEKVRRKNAEDKGADRSWWDGDRELEAWSDFFSDDGRVKFKTKPSWNSKKTQHFRF